MIKRKMESEYIDVLTSVNIDRKTDRDLKTTTAALEISRSVFVRKAIKDAIAAAGVVE